MPTLTNKQDIDGATLSPLFKQPRHKSDDALSLPIGKPVGPQGQEVAKLYKHAAGKSSTYNPQVVDMIYHMSRHGNMDDQKIATFVQAKLEAEHQQPHQAPSFSWDQLVFLSANLTRLVIDPYREKCNTAVTVGKQAKKPLQLDQPVLLDGVAWQKLPKPLFKSIVQAAMANDLAITLDHTHTQMPHHKQIITVDIGQTPNDLSQAAAVVISAKQAQQFTAQAISQSLKTLGDATQNAIPLGIVAPACNAKQVVDQSVNEGADFYICDAMWTNNDRPNAIFPEQLASPAIGVLADTVERLRFHCKEEKVSVIYRGGIRGGADAGKAICVGATAVSLGLSAIISLGARLMAIDDEAQLLQSLDGPWDDQQVAHDIGNFAKSVTAEVSMLARACGKSSVVNMEPEDLRSLSMAVSAATGVPLTGKDVNFRAEC